MSYSTRAASRAAASQGEALQVHDRFVAFALILSFALVLVAMIGASHPRPDLAASEDAPVLLGP